MALTPIASQTSDVMGGVKRVYIAEWADNLVTFDTTSGEVKTVTTGKFQEYKVRKASSGATTTATIQDADAILYHTSEIQLKFAKMDSTKRKSIEDLVKKETAIILEDNNGVMTFYGKENSCTCTAMTSGTGVAMGDVNGYQITLSYVGRELPQELATGVVPEGTPAA